MSFKEKYVDFQIMVRELRKLREHNTLFKPGDPQDQMLLFAEAALTLMTLERFFRILPPLQPTEKLTLFPLLEKALSPSNKLFPFTADNHQEFCRKISAVRNVIVHGNFEQAAREKGRTNKEEYFREDFAGQIETIFVFLEMCASVIDPETGYPKQFTVTSSTSTKTTL